ncbi:MAG TPA: undecaprenyl-diphosphate phosphatase, partial [Myxococcota bacterium]|nr:undecaprenyl-diphosphate phosphatase [Myxococcota bacterium]
SVLHGLAIRKPLYDENARLGWMVVLATIPAVIFGVFFKSEIALYFSSPLASCYFLMLTGILLLVGEYVAVAAKNYPSRTDAVIIGCAQSLALFPGLSRSGTTIAAGMVCGLSRENAARFSFLMSIPVMCGASLIASLDLFGDAELFSRLALPLSLGFMSAAITGYFVIKWFMAFLGRRCLHWFAAYCLALGLLGTYYF